MSFFGIAGAIGLLTGVGLGAFAAHGLKGSLEADKLSAFQTGVDYQLLHSVLLVLVAVLAGRDRAFVWAGDFYLAGILLFSGSLYLLALGGPRWLGPVTPLGGLSFMVGHGLLAWAFFRIGAAGQA